MQGRVLAGRTCSLENTDATEQKWLYINSNYITTGKVSSGSVGSLTELRVCARVCVFPFIAQIFLQLVL